MSHGYLDEAIQRTRRRNARLLLESELPSHLRTLVRPKPPQVPVWSQALKAVSLWTGTPHLEAGANGLILQGGTGRGKTKLLATLMFYLADVAGFSSLYLQMSRLDDEIRASWSNPPREGARSAFDIAEQALERDVIVIDDLGAESDDPKSPAIKLAREMIDLASCTEKKMLLATNLDDQGVYLRLGKDAREYSRRASWPRLVFDKNVPDYRRINDAKRDEGKAVPGA